MMKNSSTMKTDLPECRLQVTLYSCHEFGLVDEMRWLFCDN